MLDLVTCTGALWTSLATVNECRVSVRVRISLNVCVASKHPNLTRSMHTFIHTQEHCYMIRNDTDTYTYTLTDWLTACQTDKRTDRQADMQAGSQTDRHPGSQTDKQAGRQACSIACLNGCMHAYIRTYRAIPLSNYHHLCRTYPSMHACVRAALLAWCVLLPVNIG